jgi:diguanylate cyclase (GGDEF)-like protein
MRNQIIIKEQNFMGLSDIAEAGINSATPQAGDDENHAYMQLQQSLSELAICKQALAASQQHLQAALQQIEALAESNAVLRQRLKKLAKKYAQARSLAYHDELTGLPNRSLLLDRLKQAIGQSARHQKPLALLFIDLDRFKSVNDRLGHAAGDKLLQLTAERLAACIRYGDTACRYGGDEFVLMLPEIEGQESVAAVADKIRAHLSVPFIVDGNIVAITASIGIAIYRADGQNCSDLLKQADIAMYQAKARCYPASRAHQQILQN